MAKTYLQTDPGYDSVNSGLVTVLSLTAGQQVWISPDGISTMGVPIVMEYIPGSLDILFVPCRSIHLLISHFLTNEMIEYTRTPKTCFTFCYLA